MAKKSNYEHQIDAIEKTMRRAGLRYADYQKQETLRLGKAGMTWRRGRIRN